MPAAESYGEALSRTAEYIEAIGGEVVDEIETESEGGDPIDGFACAHAGESYLVLAAASEEYFKIQFAYDLFPDALGAVEEQAIEADPQLSRGDEIELEEHHFETARELVAKTISEPSEETARKLRRNLIRAIAHPPAAYSLTEHEPYRVSGFEITYKLFPYSEGFTVERFNDGVQTLVTAGIPGRLYLQRVYGFEPTDPTSEGRSEPRGYGHDGSSR